MDKKYPHGRHPNSLANLKPAGPNNRRNPMGNNGSKEIKEALEIARQLVMAIEEASNSLEARDIRGRLLEWAHTSALLENPSIREAVILRDYNLLDTLADQANAEAPAISESVVREAKAGDIRAAALAVRTVEERTPPVPVESGPEPGSPESAQALIKHFEAYKRNRDHRLELEKQEKSQAVGEAVAEALGAPPGRGNGST